jgi:hypothetical protein
MTGDVDHGYATYVVFLRGLALYGFMNIEKCNYLMFNKIAIYKCAVSVA